MNYTFQLEFVSGNTKTFSRDTLLTPNCCDLQNVVSINGIQLSSFCYRPKVIDNVLLNDIITMQCIQCKSIKGGDDIIHLSPSNYFVTLGNNRIKITRKDFALKPMQFSFYDYTMWEQMWIAVITSNVIVSGNELEGINHLSKAFLAKFDYWFPCKEVLRLFIDYYVSEYFDDSWFKANVLVPLKDYDDPFDYFNALKKFVTSVREKQEAREFCLQLG